MSYDDLPYRPGVGAMVVNAEGRVFVGRRIDNKELDAWQMPQGGVDMGEDPETALYRELEEETGIAREHLELVACCKAPYDYDIPHAVAKTLWGGKYRGQRQHWYLLRFTGRDADVDIEQPHPEFNAWRWSAMEELPELIVPFKRPLYEALVAEFGPLAVASTSASR